MCQGVGSLDNCPNAVGTAAQAAYESISGCNTPLPVSSECGHLQEDCLTDEMMTPTLWADGQNVFSSITIGWMEDIGYDVDYSQADAFDPSRLGTNPSGSCNCNRRLAESNPLLDAIAPTLSEDGYRKAHAMALTLLGNKSGVEGKHQERALAITVMEDEVLHTVVVRD